MLRHYVCLLIYIWHAQWLFDNSDGSARLLRFRAGHSAPPGLVQYYGNGTRLLSAGASLSTHVCTAQRSAKHSLYIMQRCNHVPRHEAALHSCLTTCCGRTTASANWFGPVRVCK